MRDLTKDWTQVTCLVVSHSNHYTRMFSVLVWDCKWILIYAQVISSNSSHWTKISSFWKKKLNWVGGRKTASSSECNVQSWCPWCIRVPLDWWRPCALYHWDSHLSWSIDIRPVSTPRWSQHSPHTLAICSIPVFQSWLNISVEHQVGNRLTPLGMFPLLWEAYLEGWCLQSPRWEAKAQENSLGRLLQRWSHH